MTDDSWDEKSAIKLCLNKPKSWNWELTTSKSSPNIIFPKIQLVNKKGIVLAEADEAEQVFGNKEVEKVMLDCNNNAVESLTEIVKRNTKKLMRSQSQKLDCLEKTECQDAVIASKMGAVPIQVFSEKGIKIRDFNEKEFDSLRPPKPQGVQLETGAIKKNNFLQKSRSANEIMGGRKKRRTNSMRSSNSILERISEFQRQSSSSDESLSSETNWKRPKYFFRTSKAGTLLLCEESFRCKKGRRRNPKKLSSLKIHEIDEETVPSHLHNGNDRTQLILPDDVYTPASASTPSVSRYKKEIENIDNLITNLITTRELRNGDEITSDVIADAGSINKNNFNYFSDDDENVMGHRGRNRERGEQRKKRRSSSTSRELSVGRDDSQDFHSRRTSKRRDLTKTAADQIVAINNRSTAVSNIESTANLLNTTSDQVLLKLVRRLASLQYHPDRFGTKTNNTISNITNKREGSDLYLNRSQLTRSFLNNDKSRQQHQQQQLLNSHTEWNKDEVDCTRSSQGNIEKHNNFEFPKREGRKRDDNKGRKLKEEIVNIKEVNEGYNNSILRHSNTNLNSNNKTFDNNNNNNNTNESQQQSEVVVPNGNEVESISEWSRNNIEGNNNKVEENLNKHHFDTGSENYIMGSNVSRNTEKGLSGRRTQSSGNLYNGKYPNGNKSRTSASSSAKAAKKQSKLDEKTSEVTNENVPDAPIYSHNPTDATDSIYTTKKWNNKFSGSLPNHLDIDINDDEYLQNNNNEKIEYVAGGAIIQQQPNQYYPPPPSYQPPALQHYQTGNYASPNTTDNSKSNNINAKGSSSSNAGRSTFKINPDNKPDLQLKLPIHRAANVDTGYDQGYGSERSPEDEALPPLPLIQDAHYLTNYNHQQQQQQQLLQSQMLPASQSGQMQPLDVSKEYWNRDKFNLGQYNFITQDCTFYVEIAKGPRGLGLSVSGGVDTNAAFPGLIRIKRLFPHQAAWSTGMLQPGDILLEANGITLTGLTNYEALEVLRTTPNNVALTVCRPRDEQYRKLSPPTEAPKPPQRIYMTQDQIQPFLLEPLDPLQINFCGEFEIILVKQQGSLGFTLRKEDESVLGHYVRALVREPATTDGRIKPGDKIMAVNDVLISSMTHEEAVIFLRQAAEVVKLRLYRDEAQTPVSALSPSESEYKGICQMLPKQKAHLRPEAINLLSDLAYRKQAPVTDSLCSSFRSNNTTTSPRRLRRGNKSSGGNTSTLSDASSLTNQQSYLVSGESTTYSDSDASTLLSQPNSFKIQPVSSGNSTTSCYTSYKGHDCYCEDELFQMVDDDSSVCDGDRANRPCYLELAGESGCTPMSSWKPRFQFSVAAANAYELNNLDNETLDAPTMYALSCSGGNPGQGTGGCCANDPYTINGSCCHNKENTINNNNSQDFNSLPCETFLVACKTESDLDDSSNYNNRSLYVKSFNHKNPIYQSVNVPIKDTNSIYSGMGCNRDNSVCIGSLSGGVVAAAAAATDGTGSAGGGENSSADNVKKDGTRSLLKWKGVMFSPDDDDNNTTKTTTATEKRNDNGKDDVDGGNIEAGGGDGGLEGDNDGLKTPLETDAGCEATTGRNPTSGNNRDSDSNCLTTDSEGNKIITVELNRGWNCRLGFSLQQDANTQRSVISAIYSDSVAAKDGRLRSGDELLTVNDESMESKPTNEIIDLLRIIRGSICITVLRKARQE